MKNVLKKWCSVLLSIAMLFILTSCGTNEVATDDASSTETTTITTTSTTTNATTTTRTTTTTHTTESEPTETKQSTTKINKTEPAETKLSQVKPNETKSDTTQVKPTEAKPKPTETKPQKQAPKFIFPQNFPVKVTAFNAEYEVVKAYTQNGYWYNEDTYLFDLSIVVKRCDDGINEEKASAVAITMKDSNGNVVRKTSSSAGMLSIGEQGTGGMSWSVDGPGTYTIEFSSI